MSNVALALVLTAAVLHAGWNVLLKTSGDPLRTAVRLQAIGSLVLVPVAVAAWLAEGRPPVPPTAIVLALGSGVLEATYFICLSAAYRRGDLSLVYPLARGTAPLVSVAVGLIVLGEHLGPLAVAGVTCLLVGILFVARPWRALQADGRAHRGAVAFALATGAAIAAYSTVDRVAVRLVAPWLYGAFLAVFATAILATTVAIGRGRGWIAPAPATAAPTSAWRDGTAGVLSLGAYLLILFAYALAPLAAVAPLRETGIVLAAGWGAVRLGEASGRRAITMRIASAVLVVAGAVLLAIAP